MQTLLDQNPQYMAFYMTPAVESISHSFFPSAQRVSSRGRTPQFLIWVHTTAKSWWQCIKHGQFMQNRTHLDKGIISNSSGIHCTVGEAKHRRFWSLNFLPSFISAVKFGKWESIWHMAGRICSRKMGNGE